MTRLIATNFRFRHWLVWTALLLQCALAAFGSIPKERNSTSLVYGPAGDLLAYVDGKGRTNQFAYDEYGRLTNKVDATGTTILRFKYDALGRLTNRWSNAKGDTYYTYDKVNNLTNVNYPSSPDLTFGYDPLNRLTSMTDESGSSAFTYTSFGPLRSEDGPFANDTITWDYQTNHLRSGFTLLQPNSSPVVQTYGYDNGNRLQTITGLPGTFTYSYKGVGGLLDKILYPSGAYVTNSFDNSAQLLATKLRNSSHTDLNLHSYGYNLGGQRTNQTRFDGSAVTYGYDKIGQLQSATGKESGGTSRLNEQFGYAYDAAWNVQNRTNNALVQTFNTDSLNQLTTLTRANTLTVAGMTTSPATNVTVNGYAASRYADNTFAKEGFSLSDGNNTFTAIAQDSYGRSETNAVTLNLPATVSYIYDGNGNLTSDGSKGYTYDDENQLIRITSTNSWKTEITYDGFKRRRVRSEYSWINSAWVLKAQARYVYDGKLVVQERDANNVPQVHYTRGLDLGGGLESAGGIGGLLARSQSPVVHTEHSFYHTDGSGNVTALVNSNQQVVARYLYDPFGRVLASSGPMADVNLYRFSSKEAHENSDLVYYGLRFYDPSLQRWLNGDPLREGGGINLHRFCGGDPINKIDPWGLMERPQAVADFIDSYYAAHGEIPWLGWYDTHQSKVMTGWFDPDQAPRYGLVNLFVLQAQMQADGGEPKQSITKGGLYGIQPEIWEHAKEVGNKELAVVETLVMAAVPGPAELAAAYAAAKALEKGAVAVRSYRAAKRATKLTGQIHHAISTKVGRAIDNHPVLRGVFAKRDPRFVTQAADEAAHRGYQRWHRDLDDDVVQWIQGNLDKSADDFLGYLRELYKRPDLKARFPNGF